MHLRYQVARHKGLQHPVADRFDNHKPDAEQQRAAGAFKRGAQRRGLCGALFRRRLEFRRVFKVRSQVKPHPAERPGDQKWNAPAPVVHRGFAKPGG